MSKVKENRILLAICYAFISVLIFRVWNDIDIDFYHRATSARYILQDWKYLYENPTFVIKGRQTLIQQWLYCILEYGAYTLLGENGVKLFATLQLVILLLFIRLYLRSAGLHVKMSMLLPLLLYTISEDISTRPTMLSLILLYLQLYGTERFASTKRIRYLWLLPVAMIAQANLHGAYVLVHFILLLPYIVPFDAIVKRFYTKETGIIDSSLGWESTKKAIPFMLLMLLGMCVNPYGIKLLKCTFAISSTKNFPIAEMQGMTIFSLHFAYLIIGLVLTFIAWRKQCLTSTALYFVLGTGLMYLVSIKNTSLYFIAMLMVLRDILVKVDLQSFFDFLNRASNKDFFVIAALSFLVLPIRAAADYGDRINQSEMFGSAFPFEALHYLETEEEDLSSIKVFADYNAGGYLEFHGIGGIYTSTKAEVYSKEINGEENVLEEYLLLWNNKIGTEMMETFIQKYDFDYLCVPYRFSNLQIYLDMSENYERVLVSEAQTSVYDEIVPNYILYHKSN